MATTEIFQQILREAYNHGSSKDKIVKFIQGPVTKWFTEYGYKVVGPDEELPSIPPDEDHSENCVVKYTIKNDEKKSGKYKVSFQWALIFRNYAHHESCLELLAAKVMGYKENKEDNEDWLKKNKAELQAVSQFYYKMEAEAKSFGLDIKFRDKDTNYTSLQEFDFEVTDIEGTAAYGEHIGSLSQKDWAKEGEDAIVAKFNLESHPELNYSENYSSGNVESHFYIYNKGKEDCALIRIDCYESDSSSGTLSVSIGSTNEYYEGPKGFYFSQKDYKDPGLLANEIAEVFN